MRRTGLWIVVAALFGAAVPAAWAADTFRGETGQDRTVVLTAGADDRIDRVRIGWKAGCKRGRASFEDTTNVLPPFERSTKDAFRATGAYTSTDRGGYRSKVTLTVEGKRSGARWSGTVQATVRVRRRGRAHDRCTLRTTRWSATRD